MGILDRFLGIIGTFAPRQQTPWDKLRNQTMPKDPVAWRDTTNPLAPPAVSATAVAPTVTPTTEQPRMQQPLTPDTVGPINPVMPTPTQPMQGLRRPEQALIDEANAPKIKPISVTQLPQPSQFINQPAEPQQYTPAQMQEMQSNILRTGLPGDPIAEQKAREAAVAKTRETVPMFGQPGAVPPAEAPMAPAMGPSPETPALTPAPAPAPKIEAPAATLGTAVSPRRMQTLADTGRPTFNLDGRQVVLGANGNLVTPEGQQVTNLRNLGGQVYMGKEVAVVGNDLVDMQGNKVGNFSDAYNEDRDFRFAYNRKSINERRAEAAKRGDRLALLALNEEEARARYDWEQSRPPDTTRSWGDVLKGLGLGALKGFATGGIGGAVGGAIAGGIGTAINPELRQRMQDEMFRLPQARGRLAEAQAAQEAGQKLEAGRLGVLGGEQNLQQNIIQTRATALQNDDTYKRLIAGENVTAAEITEMERRLGFNTGIKPGFRGGQTLFINGQMFRASGNTVEAVRDRNGNPVYDLTRTVVEVRDPKTGARFFASSADEAARVGQWALAQFNAEVARRRAFAAAELAREKEERAAARAQELSPTQRRAAEGDLEDIDFEISDIDADISRLAGTLQGDTTRVGGEIAAVNATIDDIFSRNTLRRTGSLENDEAALRKAGVPDSALVKFLEAKVALQKLQAELKKAENARARAEARKKRLQTSLGVAVAPPAETPAQK